MSWTFLSNHGHVIVQLTKDPELRIADLADKVGITERRVAAIIKDLEEAGYLTIVKEGRRNVYQVKKNRKLRHSAESNKALGDLLGIFD
jgi:DNA-binding MarR family transcriptional regulator